MTTCRPHARLAAALACALLPAASLAQVAPGPAAAQLAAPALATEPAAPATPPAAEPVETPIAVPPLVPTGLLVAWKPTLLSVRVDSGAGATFGSDRVQAERGLLRYTFAFSEALPLVARAELEGGRFQTDQDRSTYGSNGSDATVRALAGAAARITPGFTLFVAAGALTRYQHGYANGGAPTVGVLGAVSNFELEFRLFPVVTLSLFGEGAIAPVAYDAQANLGKLSDSSELRGRLQVSFDLSRNLALDVGYDFTRWSMGFSQSTITGNAAPDRAFFVDQREYALTLGLRLQR